MAQLSCPSCGHKVHEEDKFCPACGTRLPSRRRRKKHFPWGCCFFLLLLLGGGGVGGYYLYEFKATKDMEMAAYAALDDTDDVERYNDFIARFPDSKYCPKVRARMEALREEQSEFADLMVSGDAHALRRYLIDNPDTPRRAKIEAVLDTVEYREAVEASTVEALQEYVNTHSSSPFYDIATVKLKELRRSSLTQSEQDRLERIAERFVVAMNNGDDVALGYLLAPGFSSFNGCDTTLTSFNHDIMVYVNERIFRENEDLLLSKNNDVKIRKVPIEDSSDFRYELSFSCSLVRHAEDQIEHLGGSYRVSATLTSGGQMTALRLQ